MSDNQPSIGELISKTVSDAKRLAMAQLALAQAEVKASKKAMTSATIFGLVALVLTPLAVVFLLFTLTYVLVQLGLATWAAFGIITLLLILVTGFAGAMAKSQASKIKGPTLALRELNKTTEAFGQMDAS
ncbi:MAG: phage holin family protein [Actinomycetes bacterium]|jgi:uncharacterized membrane protein YqjE